jgi:hypothetical protein
MECVVKNNFFTAGDAVKMVCVEKTETSEHCIGGVEDLKEYILDKHSITIGWNNCFREKVRWITSRVDGSALLPEIENAIIKIERAKTLEEIVEIYNSIFF